MNAAGAGRERAELAAAQAGLVAALVAGAEPPPGFDPERLDAAARVLLRKRAGAVARAWPRLAAAHHGSWHRVFAGWAEDRPTRGAWRDGADFAREHRSALPPAAAIELAVAEATWAITHQSETRRRGVVVRRIPGGLVLYAFGRHRLLLRRPRPDRTRRTAPGVPASGRRAFGRTTGRSG